MSDLFGGAQPIQRLFVGLMVPPGAAEKAVEVRRAIRQETGIGGGEIAQERLHITLVHVKDYEGQLPLSVVADLLDTLSRVKSGAFDIELDHIGSFSGAPGKHPLVLTGDAGVQALNTFRRSVWEAVRARLKTLSTADFTAHVTLMYGDRMLPERAVDPIGWRATEFVLIHSEVGRSIYHELGRWPLSR